MTTENIKYLTEDESSRLLARVAKFGDVRDIAIWNVAYYRGLRASEVGMLQVEDYSQKDGRLFVHRLKGSASGQYKLSPTEIKVLNKWLKVRGTEPGPLFWSYRNHKRGIARRRLDQLMRKYAEFAELPKDKWHFHVLKHSIASHLLSSGADLMDVKDWLGHRSLRSTLVYAKTTSRRRDRIADEFYGKEGTK